MYNLPKDKIKTKASSPRIVDLSDYKIEKAHRIKSMIHKSVYKTRYRAQYYIIFCKR